MKIKKNSSLLVRMIIFILLFSTFLLVVDFYSIGFFKKINKNVRFILITPAHRYIYGITENISFVWNGLQLAHEKEKEIFSLRAKLREKMLDGLLIEQINLELKQMKKQLAVMENLSFKSSMARVIAHDPESHYLSILVNKGQKQGYKEGMPVMGYQREKFGLIGFLAKVSKNSSIIQTLLHQRTEASVFIAESETFGIAKGQTLSSPFIILDYIDREATGLNGKLVKTSGIGGKYPPGLLVGSIAYAVEKDYRIFRTAYIRPYINFFSLKSVYVITGEYQINIKTK